MPKSLQNNFEDFQDFRKSLRIASHFTNLGQSLQEKCHIPRWSPWKNEDFEHLNFFIFKLLSHNFLNDQLGDFQFSYKMTILTIHESLCQDSG